MKQKACWLLCAAAVMVGPALSAAWAIKGFASQNTQDEQRYLISESDQILLRPNSLASGAVPLGNGGLGAAIWAQDSFTAQLNRADTFPDRRAACWLQIPSLHRLVEAADYRGRLHLYDGRFTESGNGISLESYVGKSQNVFIVEVSGLAPFSDEEAVLKLWPVRRPKRSLATAGGDLYEEWVDQGVPGASGRTFRLGSRLHVAGLKVIPSLDPDGVRVKFKADANGRFTVTVAVPASTPHLGQQLWGNEPISVQTERRKTREWWNHYWTRVSSLQVSSPDGSGEYYQALRAFFLYISAAGAGGEYPGSQAGIADLFSSSKDVHRWDPAAYWHWNLRMQVAANMGAGVPENNEAYFRLYRNNLSSIISWTREHMSDTDGACFPETMRFNGKGIEYERRLKPATAFDCDSTASPFYNSRTLSTGAEISLWIWRQYSLTTDKLFLRENAPIIIEAAKFLLSYEKLGSDSLRHTYPSNAHEELWDVQDPITDLAARRSLYEILILVSNELHIEPALALQASEALTLIPPFTTVRALTTNEAVIAESSTVGAMPHNLENVSLETVWPYERIGLSSEELLLARSTFRNRAYRAKPDWSFDGIHAARLGLSADMEEALRSTTERYQVYQNGFARTDTGDGGEQSPEFYIEQAANIALTLQEAVCHDFAGILYLNSAIPSTWTVHATFKTNSRTHIVLTLTGGQLTSLVVNKNTRKPLSIAFRGKKTGYSTISIPRGRSELRVNNLGTVSFHLTRTASTDRSVVRFTRVNRWTEAQPRSLGTSTYGSSLASSWE